MFQLRVYPPVATRPHTRFIERGLPITGSPRSFYPAFGPTRRGSSDGTSAAVK